MAFQSNFLWGAATAAHQVEGAYLEDGKTPGIWDAMVDDKVKHGETAKISADHYHHMKEDVALMKEIGLKAYRFSISWPRVMSAPGVVNEKGLQFYQDLVDELKHAGIEPLCTLFHWNLPMWAQDFGGWESEEVVPHFLEYVKVVVDALSDRVKYYMTFNEPQCFIGCGYQVGVWPPYVKDIDRAKKASRNVMLAHGKAVKLIRESAKQPVKIGMAPTGNGFTPWDETDEAIEAARKKTYSLVPQAFSNPWWSDTIVLGQIPDCLADVITEEDLNTICQPLDFYAFNIYNSQNYVDDFARNEHVYPGMPRTTMDWTINPEVLYWITKFHYERYHLPILISENGMANTDFEMLDGKVHDPQRIDFIHRYLKELKRAVSENIPVIGYCYWSLMDNFEWMHGFDKRFGLIYIDYRTGKRIIKDSGYEYAEIIRTNGANIG